MDENFNQNDDLLDDEYWYDIWLEEQAEKAQFNRIFNLTGTYPI